jgi:hypothetical protein
MKTLFVITTAIVMCSPGILSAQPLGAPGAPGGGGFGLGAAEAVAVPRPTQPKPATGSSRSGSSSSVTYFATASSSRGDSIPPVMIRFSQPDAKAAATLEEDLFVMARVLSRTLERAEAEKVDYKMNVPMLLTGSGRSVRPMYLEGTGPLFMIKVNFPLIPTPKPEAKSAKKANDDSEWDAAQRDLFDDAEVTYEEASSRNGYKEEQVELLKKELIGALKNAANIRGLRLDEFVNIAVFGQSSGARVKTVTLPGAAGGLTVTAGAYNSDLANAGKGSVLTLRAKKSDIDAFAAGKLDAAAFKEKVAVTAYAGSGVGITSINSWIEEKPGRSRQ